MRRYERAVQYYETDRMGITHHANYIHWMEEARIDYLEQLGFPYSRLESEGIFSPVRSVSCKFKRPSTFGDLIKIQVHPESFNGIVLTMRYEMRDQREAIVCEAGSEHVFVDREGRLIRLEKEQPEFFRILGDAVREAESAE